MHLPIVVMAAAVGLQQLRPLVATTENLGHGRVGRLPSAMSLLEFARRLATVLPSTATGIRVAGDPELQVSTVALCGGAGDGFIADALATEADLYMTSDLRHHPVQEAMQLAQVRGRNFAMIDISHWAAEWIWLDTAKAELAAQFPQVTFEVSDLRTDPWDFVVTQ